MKGYIFHGVYALFAVLVAPAAMADPIPGLFNTGQGLSPGMQDSHYAGGAGSFVVSPHADGVWSWLGAVGSLPANTQWFTQNHIGPQASQGLNNTAYNYSLSFNLAGLDASSAVIHYQFAADNNLEVRLNGTLVGALIGGGPADATTFNSLHTGTTINSSLLQSLGTAFLAGLNTLEFRVINLTIDTGQNPEGLLVAISGTAAPGIQGALPIPEPASVGAWALLGFLGAVVGWLRCHQRGASPARSSSSA